MKSAKAGWISQEVIFLLILVAAFALRLYVATTSAYLADEYENAIPLAETISFELGQLNLPIRGIHHPALPSYFVKASSMLAGKTPLGYRFLHVVAGLFTIFMIYRVANDWFGATTATWAAALLAFNEYHIGVSAFATAKGPHLLFVTLTIYAFSRFLRMQQLAYLYVAGATTGLAFYCKEHSVLLIPVFFLTLLQARYRHWFRSSHVYLACAVFLVVIGPDILWNLRTTHSDVQATYRDHLSRIGGVGFTAHYFLFFARDAFQWFHTTVTGDRLVDTVAENPSMNWIFGSLLLGAVLAATLRPVNENGNRGFLLILFWVVLGFFVMIRPGEPPKDLDDVTWYWVDATLFPAVILAGSYLEKAAGPWRRPVYCVTGCAILYAIAQTIGLIGYGL